MAKATQARLTPRQVQEELQRLRGLFTRDYLVDQPSGVHLPSVNEVVNSYQVPLALARKLYEALQADGAVTSKPRKGYFTADPAAALLKGGRQQEKAVVIGLVGYLEPGHPESPRSRTALVLESFEKLANAQGWRVEYINTYPGETLTEDHMLCLAGAKVNAAIYLPRTKKPAREVVRLRKLEKPIFSIACHHPGITNIDYDNRLIGYNMGRYLVGCGFERMAYVGVKGAPWSVQRWQGFLEAFTAPALAEPLLLQVTYNPETHTTSPVDLKDRNLDAVFCANDETALALIDYGFDRSHMALAGVDDGLESRVCGLTTIQRSYESISAEMMKLLSRHLKLNLPLPEEVFLKGQVLRRGSTENLRRCREIQYA